MTKMTNTIFGKIGIGLLCLGTLWSLAGCSSKSDSDKPTAEQVQAFNGHKPNPDQLKAAMSRVSQPPATPPAPSANH